MNAPPSLDARRDATAVALLIVLALAIQLPLYDRWLSLLDEGAIAQIADQITRGGLPYRDGVHVALPGIFYLTAGLYGLFGASLVVGRWLMVAAFSALVALVYLLARSVAGRTAAFIVGLLCVAYRAWAFPHWQMLSYSPLAILLVMVAAGLLVIDIGKPRPHWVPLAGAVTGCAALFKQDSAGIGFVALTLWVLVSGYGSTGSWPAALRRAGRFGLAGALPVVAVLLAFVPSGLTLELLHQTVWFPLVAQPVWASAAGGGHYTAFPTLWPPWEMAEAIRGKGLFSYFPSLLLDLHWRDIIASPLYKQTLLPEIFVRVVFLLPYGLLAILIGHEVRSHRSKPDSERSRVTRQRLRLLLVLGVALILSFNRPRDWVHLLVLYPGTLVLLAPLIELAAGHAAGLRRRSVMALSAGLTSCALAASVALVMAAREHYSVPIRSERAGLYASEHVAAVLNPLLDALATPAGQEPAALAALPASPALNFLLERPLATRFLTLLPLQEFEDRDAQVLADLARHPEADYVYSLNRASYTPRPQDYMPEVFEALIDRHQLGAGPGRVFSGTRMDGLLLARLDPRSPVREAVLYDFAEQLGKATIERIDVSGRVSATQAQASVDAWPFESPLLTIAPPLPPESIGIRYRVEVPERARLRFGVAMNPDTWAGFLPTALHFVATVDGEPVFDTILDPRVDVADRRWVWADVPIEAGTHEVSFQTSTNNAFGAKPGIAGWARPRLVRAP